MRLRAVLVFPWTDGPPPHGVCLGVWVVGDWIVHCVDYWNWLGMIGDAKIRYMSGGTAIFSIGYSQLVKLLITHVVRSA